MPNLELSFGVHEQGYRWKNMRRVAMIGHRDSDGKHRVKFTKNHYMQACESIKQWMLEYNKMVDKPEPVVDKKCDSWACLESSEGCKCHD